MLSSSLVVCIAKIVDCLFHLLSPSAYLLFFCSIVLVDLICILLGMVSGWLDCPAFGEPIDKIIPSKVPLDETFNESVPPGKRYSSKQLVNKQRKAGREVSIACLLLVNHTIAPDTV